MLEPLLVGGRGAGVDRHVVAERQGGRAPQRQGRPGAADVARRRGAVRPGPGGAWPTLESRCRTCPPAARRGRCRPASVRSLTPWERVAGRHQGHAARVQPDGRRGLHRDLGPNGLVVRFQDQQRRMARSAASGPTTRPQEELDKVGAGGGRSWSSWARAARRDAAAGRRPATYLEQLRKPPPATATAARPTPRPSGPCGRCAS